MSNKPETTKELMERRFDELATLTMFLQEEFSRQQKWLSAIDKSIAVCASDMEKRQSLSLEDFAIELYARVDAYEKRLTRIEDILTGLAVVLREIRMVTESK